MPREKLWPGWRQPLVRPAPHRERLSWALVHCKGQPSEPGSPETPTFGAAHRLLLVDSLRADERDTGWYASRVGVPAPGITPTDHRQVRQHPDRWAGTFSEAAPGMEM